TGTSSPWRRRSCGSESTSTTSSAGSAMLLPRACSCANISSHSAQSWRCTSVRRGAAMASAPARAHRGRLFGLQLAGDESYRVRGNLAHRRDLVAVDHGREGGGGVGGGAGEPPKHVFLGAGPAHVTQRGLERGGGGMRIPAWVTVP